MSEEKRLEELLDEHLEEQRELGNYGAEPEEEREEETDEAVEVELKEQVEELQNAVKQMREHFEEDSRKKSGGKKCQRDGIVEFVKRHMVGAIIAVFVMAALVWWYAPHDIPDAEHYYGKGYASDGFYDNYTTAEEQAKVATKFRFKGYLKACNLAINRPFPLEGSMRIMLHDFGTDDEDHDDISMDYDIAGGKYSVWIRTEIQGARRSSPSGEEIPQEITSELIVRDYKNRLIFQTTPEKVYNLADVVWDEAGWLGSVDKPFFCGRETFEALINLMQSGTLKAKTLDPMTGVGRTYKASVDYDWDHDDAPHDRAWYESLPFPVYDGNGLVNADKLDRHRPEDDPEEAFYRDKSW